MGLTDRIEQGKKGMSIEEKELLIDYVKKAMFKHTERDNLFQLLNHEVKNYIESRLPNYRGEVNLLTQECYDRLYSLGPLEKYIRNPQITDIQTFGTKIMFKENGFKKDDPEGFLNKEELERIVDRIMSQAKSSVNISRPSRDIELYDGSRAIVILPPEADEIYISIRKHTMIDASLEDLSDGMRGLTPEIISYLTEMVRTRKNIAIFGETGAGKTTLINALCKYIQPTHKVAVLEDTRELNLSQKYVMYLKTREATEGALEITYNDVLKDCLRIDPDRIILTEVRSATAAYGFIHTLNSGHKGSFTTGHANSIYDGLVRLELLVQEHSRIDLLMARKIVARAINIVGYIEVEEDNEGRVLRRKLAQLAEIRGVLNGDYDLRYIVGNPT